MANIHNATDNESPESSAPVAGNAATVAGDTFKPSDACTVGLATTNVWLPSPTVAGNAACAFTVPLALTVYEPSSERRAIRT